MLVSQSAILEMDVVPEIDGSDVKGVAEQVHLAAAEDLFLYQRTRDVHGQVHPSRGQDA